MADDRTLSPTTLEYRKMDEIRKQILPAIAGINRTHFTKNLDVLGGTPTKTDCTCLHVNGIRKYNNPRCSIHTLPPASKPHVFKLESKLLTCRFCGRSIKNKKYHMCTESKQRNGTAELRSSGRSDYCKCTYDENGCRVRLSFDCEEHCK